VVCQTTCIASTQLCRLAPAGAAIAAAAARHCPDPSDTAACGESTLKYKVLTAGSIKLCQLVPAAAAARHCPDPSDTAACGESTLKYKVLTAGLIELCQSVPAAAAAARYCPDPKDTAACGESALKYKVLTAGFKAWNDKRGALLEAGLKIAAAGSTVNVSQASAWSPVAAASVHQIIKERVAGSGCRACVRACVTSGARC
jgi:hypothetical protein